MKSTVTIDIISIQLKYKCFQYYEKWLGYDSNTFSIYAKHFMDKCIHGNVNAFKE